MKIRIDSWLLASVVGFVVLFVSSLVLPVLIIGAAALLETFWLPLSRSIYQFVIPLWLLGQLACVAGVALLIGGIYTLTLPRKQSFTALDSGLGGGTAAVTVSAMNGMGCIFAVTIVISALLWMFLSLYPVRWDRDLIPFGMLCLTFVTAALVASIPVNVVGLTMGVIGSVIGAVFSRRFGTNDFENAPPHPDELA